MTRFIPVLFALAALGGVALLAFLFIPVQRTPAQAALPPDWQPAEGQGEYAMRVADCAACHTAPDGAPFAGNRAIESPLGTIYSANITPDPETGIGNWSLDDFRAALYDGMRPDGSHLYPAMPYENFRRMTEEDIRAIYSYFMDEVEPVHQPTLAAEVPFPFNQTWGLRAWKWVALTDQAGFTPTTDDPLLARGEYIVEGPGHCSACHSPRNLVMAQAGIDLRSADYLAGGEVEGWTAPPLRGLQSAVRGWSAEDIALILATGRNAHAATNGQMQLVVRDSTSHLTEEDLMAIGAFLVSVNDPDAPRPGAVRPQAGTTQTYAQMMAEGGSTETQRLLMAADPDMALGPRLYLDNCSACHFVDGLGADEVFPELDGNSLVTAEHAAGLISIILVGGELPSTPLRPYRLKMPGFGDRLSDEEIAELASFVRSAWTNNAPPVTAGDVSDLRGEAETVVH